MRLSSDALQPVMIFSTDLTQSHKGGCIVGFTLAIGLRCYGQRDPIQ